MTLLSNREIREVKEISNLTRQRIFDINGKLAKQIDPNSSIENLDISDLSKGQYIFSFETSDNIIKEKTIKVE